MPTSSSHLTTCKVSSIVVPFFSHGKIALPLSTALIFDWTWKSSPTSARMARMTSSRKRARLASDPPYSSVRSLMAGLRNCVNR